MQNIRISNISYINTLPFRTGLAGYQFPDSYNVVVSEDIPSECAAKLRNSECDLGIVPVAALSEIEGVKTVSDYCIASLKEVRSVMLFSHCKLSEITDVYLDYQSRTSVKLVQYLAAEKWKRNFRWLKATQGYENEIKDTTAGLIIGDRALKMYDLFPNKYDLAAEWNQFTGLPFVFAVWVANKNVPDDFLQHFNQALSLGISELDKNSRNLQVAYSYDIVNYLRHNIYYNFDENCRMGLNFFLKSVF